MNDILFCHKPTDTSALLTDETREREITIAILTDNPLEAPLKGFSPNQANLISTLETGLETPIKTHQTDPSFQH